MFKKERENRIMLHIAVVEDEDLYAGQIEDYLRQYSRERGILIRTERFRDGDEIAEDYKGGFDIILMDIQMQFMDGMTAAEQIRKIPGACWDTTCFTTRQELF